MAHDAELDRLKAAQDQAFQRKQKVYDAMQVAWQRRSTAHDAMDRAYYDKQIAHKVINDAWQSYQFVRQHNGPRIDGLNSAQEDAFQNMKQYFDSASNAHEARDGASARYYADQGHYYKQVAQNCVVERRQLVQEVRDARERHEATRPSFEHAKAIFIRAKEEYNRAKEEHLRAQEEFKRAKAAFDEAKTAFRRRLEALKTQAQKKDNDEEYIRYQRGLGHHGGYGLVRHGWVDGKPVTVMFGWGTKEGHALLADGHRDPSTFRESSSHSHYGPGRGAHGNVKERFRYSGPGS